MHLTITALGNTAGVPVLGVRETLPVECDIQPLRWTNVAFECLRPDDVRAMASCLAGKLAKYPGASIM